MGYITGNSWNDDSYIHVLRLYIVDKKTLKHIGALYDVSPERIRQVKAKAIRMLRRGLQGKHSTPWSPVLMLPDMPWADEIRSRVANIGHSNAD